MCGYLAGGDGGHVGCTVVNDFQQVSPGLTVDTSHTPIVRFFEKAVKANGVPEKIVMDKSDANKAAMDEINSRGESQIVIRQVK